MIQRMIRHQPAVTELLSSWRNGDEEAGEAALALVYGELRRIAKDCFRGEAIGHTLQPTALVHEVYLRLMGGPTPDITTRSHLIGVAARLMRQILVNYAHRRQAACRGGGRPRIALEPALALFEDRCVDLVALDEALEELTEFDPRQARVVELRFFGGLTVQETAEVLGVSVRTVERDWTMARAWLRREITAT
jgi:RNA polymerase sigma factor (TIGR02999 family)